MLILPAIVAITHVPKLELGISSTFLNGIRSFFAAVDGNPGLLIPALFIDIPCTAMIINLLACMHLTRVRERKELLVTIKYRPVNRAIFLLSFAILVFFLLPDRMSFP
jgi:hypothetical protein